MNARAPLAVGAEAEVIVDAAAFLFAECAVEEEIENSFYIVTAHQSEPAFIRKVTTLRPAPTPLLHLEFLFFLFLELELRFLFFIRVSEQNCFLVLLRLRDL